MKIKTLFLSLIALHCLIPAQAMTIKKAIRDYHYRDIFNYKSHLIGKPESHKFEFLSVKPEKSRPEVFTVSLKGTKAELGRTFRVVLLYKPSKAHEIQRKETTLVLDKKRMSLEFHFNSREILEQGRVEFWNVLVEEDGELKARFNATGQPLPQ